MEISQSFTGPLPPPEILAGYEAISPGFALRIIEMAEQQGNHRRAMENKTVDAGITGMHRQYDEARLGQIFAFLIAAMFLGCGTYIAIRGEPWAGALFGGIGLGGIVTTFIMGRTSSSESERAGGAGKDQVSPRQTLPAKSKR